MQQNKQFLVSERYLVGRLQGQESSLQSHRMQSGARGDRAAAVGESAVRCGTRPELEQRDGGALLAGQEQREGQLAGEEQPRAGLEAQFSGRWARLHITQHSFSKQQGAMKEDRLMN